MSVRILVARAGLHKHKHKHEHIENLFPAQQMQALPLEHMLVDDLLEQSEACNIIFCLYP